MTDLLQLLAQLPQSEPQLLERSRDFALLLAETVLGWQWRKSSLTGRRCFYPPDRWPDYMDGAATGSEPIVPDLEDALRAYGFPDPWDLATAKAATDVFIAKGWQLQITHLKYAYECYLNLPQGDTWTIACAPTEELARSAACVLAADWASRGVRGGENFAAAPLCY